MNLISPTAIDLPLFIRGKVRDVYDLGEQLLIVSSDRISAYDYVLPTLVPDKGKILNQLSIYWFKQTETYLKNHFITADVKEYPVQLKKHEELLKGRSMLVWKTDKIPIECVARGYLSGSGWKEYRATGKVCGVSLPSGLKESEKLPEPIFTPATKEEGGKHDQNISLEEMKKILGEALSEDLKRISISIYRLASLKLFSLELILADTKFEFGIKKGTKGENQIFLIDECLTPDSSRFWEKKDYKTGISPVSFDKQFVRDYLDSIRWNREPPIPELPNEIVEKTRAKYLEAYLRITGARKLDD
ncbi:MAG: phosphoribosylaminoimidazolesuccinocarboxamide synthase [Elusimicrobia bacterium]|nr:phosphoribosylaminoimidazolesuccinocarboxamide synthase [Elusimicrobiota bacterium]